MRSGSGKKLDEHKYPGFVQTSTEENTEQVRDVFLESSTTYLITETMKKIVGIAVLTLLVGVFGCKTKSSTSSTNSGDEPVTHGVVSHQYHSTGCASVIIVDDSGDAGVTITLIPKDPLSSKLDKEGTKVTFSYTLLRMPNPEGCTVGMPAEIRNLKAAK
jgi:hypothetical protein